MRPIHVVVLVNVLLGLGCSPAHIKTYAPKQRDYTLPPSSAPVAEESSPGSLLRQDGSSTILFTDPRALRVNDVLIVKIEEVADAQRQSQVDMSRDAQSNHVVRAVPFLGRLTRDVNPPLNLEQESQFNGEGADSYGAQGSTGRTERFVATVPVVVRRVLPNGNLFVEGHRVILVNEEEHHFYVSGVVRPIDIDQQNSIKSSQVADAEIEFVGRGVITNNEEEGWLRRVITFLRPF